MSRRIVMGERVPTSDLVHRVAHLLNRFADPAHEGLKDKKFERFVYPLTGVIVRRTWSDNPALVLFCFFVTGRRGTPSEMNKLMSVEFDVNDFHANPMTYISNLVSDTAKRIHAANQAQLGIWVEEERRVQAVRSESITMDNA